MRITRHALALTLSVVVSLLVVTAPVTADEPAEGAAAAVTVGISQVANGGPESGTDNFIELENFSDETVDVSGWRAFRCFGAGALASSPQVPALDAELAPGETFLIANQHFSGPIADATYTAGNSLANAGFGVQLVDDRGVVRDSVGVYDGVDSPCTHGAALPNALSFASAEAYQRTDFTGSNAADYEIVARDPQPFAEPDILPVCEVMGPGLRSPFAPETGTGVGAEDVTVTGVVYAAQVAGSNDGVWIQDTDPPDEGCEGASDGIFLFIDSTPAQPFDRYDLPEVGDEVIVTGRVSEFFDSSQLNLNRPDLGNRLQRLSRGNDLPEPTVIDVHEARAQGADQAYYASLHQMRVELVGGQTYVGTNTFGEAFLVPGEIDERVRRTDERWDLFALDDGNLPDGGVANVWAFDEVAGAVGPLDFSFDNFKLIVEDARAVETTDNQQSRPHPIREQPAGTLGLGTFNIENVFGDPAVIAEEEGIGVIAASDLDEDGNVIAQPDDPGANVVTPSLEERQRRRDMVAIAIVEHMNLPVAVGVQEIANETLLSQMAARVNEELDARGLDGHYEAILVPGNDARFIDVGFLVDTERVAYDNVGQIAPDAPATTQNPAVDGRCAQGPGGAFLHDRVPLRIDLTERQTGERLTMVTIHNKSRSGGTEQNEEFEPCRVDQTRSVIDDLDAQGLGERVVIAGDLNTFRDSPTLDLYKDHGFVNMVDLIPEDRRFTFAFSGRVQFLDHFIVSPDLAARVGAVDSPKIVNDAPLPQEFEDPTTGTGSSDHDPIIGYVAIPGLPAVADIGEVRGRAWTARQIVVPVTVTDRLGAPVEGAALDGEVTGPEGEDLDAVLVERDAPGEYHLRFRAEQAGEHAVRVHAGGVEIGAATIDVEAPPGRGGGAR